MIHVLPDSEPGLTEWAAQQWMIDAQVTSGGSIQLQLPAEETTPEYNETFGKLFCNLIHLSVIAPGKHDDSNGWKWVNLQPLLTLLKLPTCRLETLEIKGDGEGCVNELEARKRMQVLKHGTGTQFLKVLRFTDIGIDTWMVRAIFNLISRANSQLKEFHLVFNHIQMLFEISPLSRALKGEHCKLETLIIEDAVLGLGYADMADLLEGIAESSLRCLRELILVDGRMGSGKGPRKACTASFGKLLTTKGNHLRILKLSSLSLTDEALDDLVKAMLHENNQIEELETHSGPTDRASASTLERLANALTHPHVRLRRLDTGLPNDVTEDLEKLSNNVMFAFASALEHPNNRLERLKLCKDQECDVTDGACAIVRSLKSPNNKLLELVLPPAGDIIEPLAESLRVNNRIRMLEGMFKDSSDIWLADESTFVRACRTCPSLKHLCLWSRGVDYEGLLAREWRHVMYALLSLADVPRLAKASPARMVPVRDLIWSIAEVLGWPLDSMQYVIP